MLRPIGSGLAGRMEREAEESEAAYPGQRRFGLSLRGHPPAKRASTGEQRQVRGELRRLRHRSADGRMRNPGRIDPLPALLHVRELEAQGGDASLLKPPSVGLHRLVRHSRAGPVRENVERPRIRRAQKQARDLFLADRDREFQRLGQGTSTVSFASRAVSGKSRM